MRMHSEDTMRRLYYASAAQHLRLSHGHIDHTWPATVAP